MRTKQLIIHTNLSKMKNKILPTCVKGNYRDSLGEFSDKLCQMACLGLRRFTKSTAQCLLTISSWVQGQTWSCSIEKDGGFGSQSE